MPVKSIFCLYLVITFLCGCQTLSPRNKKPYLKPAPDINQEIKKCIREKRVMAGMTKDQVRASLGEPKRISRFDYKEGGSEVWIYGNCPPDCSILYFGKEGKLNNNASNRGKIKGQD
ncbi:MAG: hypothetical protein PHN57_08845 [Candidatus Omnitrophica bacterium]|nr:hypothetical protein [Candidatus Omnitrophota bacterium]